MHREGLAANAVTFSLDSSSGRSAELSASEVAEKLSRFKMKLVQALNPQSTEFKVSGVTRMDDEDVDLLCGQIQAALHINPEHFTPEQRIAVLEAITEATRGYTVKSGFASGALAILVKKIEKI